MSTRVEDLTDVCREKFHALAGWLQAEGIPYAVIFTRRTDAEQVALYAQGREPLEVVNAKRKAAGMPPTKDTGKVTNCDGIKKRSPHQDGRAFDLTFADVLGNPIWPKDPVRWLALGSKAEELGLVWGGRFTPLDPVTGLGWDPDHFEVPA